MGAPTATELEAILLGIDATTTRWESSDQVLLAIAAEFPRRQAEPWLDGHTGVVQGFVAGVVPALAQANPDGVTVQG